MRALIADALVAVTGLVVRQVDPSAREVHLTRVAKPFGDAFPIPAVSDPCVPRGVCYIDVGFGPEQVVSHPRR